MKLIPFVIIKRENILFFFLGGGGEAYLGEFDLNVAKKD
jgi:hypothetical protein